MPALMLPRTLLLPPVDLTRRGEDAMLLLTLDNKASDPAALCLCASEAVAPSAANSLLELLEEESVEICDWPSGKPACDIWCL